MCWMIAHHMGGLPVNFYDLNLECSVGLLAGIHHYNYVIMSAMASQITSLAIVYSTVYSMRRSRKTSKLRVTGLCAGIHRSPVNSPQKRASNAENVSTWWRHHDSARNWVPGTLGFECWPRRRKSKCLLSILNHYPVALYNSNFKKSLKKGNK